MRGNDAIPTAHSSGYFYYKYNFPGLMTPWKCHKWTPDIRCKIDAHYYLTYKASSSVWTVIMTIIIILLYCGQLLLFTVIHPQTPVSPAPRRLIDGSGLETAGWPVTLSPCKWAALGPGGCPCGPAPCLVVLSADWSAGAWSGFMRCGPAAGTKTRRTGGAPRRFPVPSHTQRVHRDPV